MEGTLLRCVFHSAGVMTSLTCQRTALFSHHTSLKRRNAASVEPRKDKLGEKMPVRDESKRSFDKLVRNDK